MEKTDVLDVLHNAFEEWMPDARVTAELERRSSDFDMDEM